MNVRLFGALLLLLSLGGWWIDRPLFCAAWLAAWWFCGGVMLGAAANRSIHVLTGGRWGEALRPATQRLLAPVPAWLLLFLPVLIGLPALYPWAADPVAWAATMREPGFAQAWFRPAWFCLRLALYGAAFWWLARPVGPRTAARAAIALLVYMSVGSLAAFDLLMSLVPAWSSSVFGWLALSGQLASGLAAATLLAATRGDLPVSEPPVSRDLGNLLLMFVMVQAYLQFMQLLIIWAENLPREISWYLPRFQTGWADVGIALVLLQFGVPFVALLWRRVKDRPARLAGVACGFLVMQAIGAAWLVVPSVQPHGYLGWLQLPLCMAGMAAFLFGDLARLPRIARSWRIAHGRT